MRAGYNQYAPMEGTVPLREAIATKLRLYYGLTRDPLTEVTVTLGATEAIYSAIQAAVGAGDEVIAFDPAYDSYEPAVRLAGARCIRLPLSQPGFRYDWERVRAVSERAHPADHLQQPAQPGLHHGFGAGPRRARRARPAIGTSWSCPTRSTSTWCSTARSTTRSQATRSLHSAASRCSPSARPCMRRGCASATAWHRRC